MSAKTTSIIINLAGIIIVAVLFAGNQAPLNLQLAGTAITVPSGASLIALYVIGALLSFCAALPLLKGSQDRNIEKLKDWQKQDAKLSQEIQSDKERLLEAKIATLEAALKQALKK